MSSLGYDLRSARGHLALRDGRLILRATEEDDAARDLGPIDDPATGFDVPAGLDAEYAELLDLWRDGPTAAEYRDEVRRSYLRGLT
jgi:hypothetical protein